MNAHEKFNFKKKEDLVEKIHGLGADIPLAENCSALFEKISIAGRMLPNRLVVNPMEGADSDGRGAPSELTFRRYQRFASGGSSVIWFEATAVRQDGRSNPHQLFLQAETVDAFKRLVEETRSAAERTFGAGRSLLLILQITHSGRNSKPLGTPVPVIAQHNPHLDPPMKLPPDFPVIHDDELVRLQEIFVRAGRLAAEAGFDGVDVKACHGYLVSELLGSFMREDSRYGGPFENRTHFLLETMRQIREAVPGLILTCRLSAYDSLPFPYGFGVDRADPQKEDLTEPKALVRELFKVGLPLLHVSLGIPRYKPQYGRPFDMPVRGGAVPDEHPLTGVARHIRIAGALQREFADLAVIGSGYSWLRQFFPYAAAAAVREKRTSLIGLGRGSLGYPDFARELAEKGRLHPARVCTTCSQCSELLRAGRPTGCTIRDAGLYLREYNDLVKTG